MAFSKNPYTMYGGLWELGRNFGVGNEGGGLGAGGQGPVWKVSELGGPCWWMLKDDVHPGSMGDMDSNPLALYINLLPRLNP